MELPIIAPAPVVTEHAAVFRDVCENQCQFRHVQHALTGVIVLPHKRLATLARGLLESADHTHLSRLLSEAPWREDEVNRRRIRFMRQQTKPHRRRPRESLLAIDATLCEPVGSLFDDVDRHDHHRAGTSPVAHTPVTGFSVSGPVRFPWGRRLSRRDEALTQWEADVATHVPARKLPTENKARNRLHKQVDPVWLQDPEFQARHEPFRTNMALAMEWVEEAIRRKVPVGVGVVDAWYLAADVVRVLARRRKDWVSRLNTNRRLETASVQRRDIHGWAMQLPGPHLAVEALVPLIPAQAYRPVTVGEHTDWCFTLRVRSPGLGQGRIVVSCETEPLTGRAVVWVANRVDWSAATIMARYGQRWPTETFSQDSTGPLGVNAYRRRRAEAIGTHWCLVFVASSLWHLTCLPAGPDRTTHLIPSMGDACRQQGRAWLQPLLVFVHDRLSSGATVDHVFAYLLAKKRGIVPA